MSLPGFDAAAGEAQRGRPEHVHASNQSDGSPRHPVDVSADIDGALGDRHRLPGHHAGIHGGLAELPGDGSLLGVFGIPHANEDDAMRALRAACDLRDAIGSLGLLATVGVRDEEGRRHQLGLGLIPRAPGDPRLGGDPLRDC